MGMVRLKDVALRAGVSIMTVSKALRNEPDISAGTKARIKLLAQQMGYVPDSAARSLRLRNNRLFGIIVPNMNSPTYARVVMAIEDRAQELGFDLLFAQSMNLPEREEACIRRFLSRRVDGIFISPVYRIEPEAHIYVELEARKTPVILLGPNAPFCSRFFGVDAGDLMGSYAVTQHLLKLGHRKIAFFAGPPAASWAKERFEGYCRALRDANLDVDESMVFQSGTNIEDGLKTALQMMNENCPATAVQAINDLVAIGCANAFMTQGVKIPDDLSVAGYGNLLTSEHYRIPLTTVRQPKARLGNAAMDMMQQLLRGQRPEIKRLAAELSVRDSTARPRQTQH